MNHHSKLVTQNATSVAVNDVFSAHGNTPLVISASQLTANDADVDGGTLSVVSVDNASAGVTVSLDWNGNIVVTTDEDFSGPATFDYTIEDGQGGTSTAQVTVNVAPIVQATINPSGPEIQVNTTTQGGQFQSSIAVLANGNIVMTWTDTSRTGDDFGDAVRGQIVDVNGNKIGGEFLVNTTKSANETEPQTTALANGGFVVTWQDSARSGDIRAQRFNADGSKAGGEFVVNTTTRGTQDAPVITSLSNGGFVVSWEDLNSTGGDIKARIFNASGVGGSEFVVNTTTTSGQFAPTITSLLDGGFVVSWEDDSGTNGDAAAIRAQMFNAGGNRVGDEVVVNVPNGGEQDAPTITALAGGGFVVAWEDFSGFAGDACGGIVAQIFNSQGAKVDGQFLVNTTTDGSQLSPRITALSDGKFVVVWESDGSDGSPVVRGQVFDGSGNKVGREFPITPPENNQTFPSIAALPDGRFVASWSDSTGQGPDSDGFGVKAQIFSVDTNRAPTDEALTLDQAVLNNDGRLAENSAAGTAVGTVQGVDPDRDALTYSLVNLDRNGQPITDGTGAFTIDARTGAITVANSGALDFESATSHDVRVTVTDPFGLSFDKTFTINLSDVNEKPTITAFSFANGDTVPENSANGTVIGSVAASDPDAGDQLSYSLSNNANGAFAIDANGVVTVADSSKLDFETDPVQTIEVVVTDKGGLTDTRTVTIDLSNVNEAPVASNVSLSTNEDTALTTTAAQLLAAGNVSDPDAGDVDSLTVGNATHGTVSLTNGTVVFTPAANFSGVAGYDYTVTDAGGLSVTKHVTVDVQPVADTPTLLAGQVVAGHANGAGQFKVNSDQSIGFRPAITQLADGGYLVTYNDTSRRGDDPTEGIRAQRFDASGNPVDMHGNAVSPSDPLHGQFLVNSTINRDQRDSSVTSLAGGGWVVLWEDQVTSSDSDVKAQVYDAAGNKVGGEVLVNQVTDGAQDNRVVAALGNGNFVVTWDDTSASSDGNGSAIKARIIDAGGNPLGGEFVVNSVTSGNQQFPTVAGLSPSSLLPNGGFIDTWFDASTNVVKAKIFDLNGNVAKDEFTVSNNQAGGQQIGSVVTQLANGNILVAWRDASGNDGDPSGSGLDGQILNPDGTKLGGEFLINTALPGVQKQVTITALANGDFVAVWTDPSFVGGDTSADAIKAQVFSASGTKLGGEILVNTLTAGDQINPAVTAFGPNGFIVAWTDNGGNNGGGVQAQTFTLLNTGFNTAQQISIAAASTDTDGSETLTTVVSGIPSGAILSDGHGHSSSAGATSVDVSSWNLATLTVLPPLDFIGNFQLTVTTSATDSAVLSDGQTHTSTNLAQATQTFTVIVTDAKPTITAFSFANGDTIPENSSNGTVVGAVVASDPDVGDSLTYSLSNNANGAFAIDANGVVTVADSSKLDFETNPVQTIVVVVTDKGGLTDTRTVTIDLSNVNEKPTITGFNFANGDTIPENSANGTVIGSVAASDPDAGDQLSYSLSNNANGAFAIDANGVVTVADSSKLDFETNPVQTIEVVVTDKGGLTDTRTVTIDLSNVNEAPVASNVSLSTNEDTALTTTAAQLLAAGNVSDPDAGDVDTLTAVGNATHGTVSLTNGTVVFTPTANFSGVAGYDYTVTDAGGLSITRHVTVDVQPVADTPTVLAGQVVAQHGAGQFQVNPAAAVAFMPSITQLADGGFLVTYNDTSRRGDDPTEGIRAQRFDANGNPVDVHGNAVSPADPLHGQFLVNSTTNRDQLNSKVATLTGGGFVVAWQGQDTGSTSDFDVRAQAYDANGNKVGGEILVNNNQAGSQANISIAALGNGGFVVTYDDTSGDDGSQSGIKARIFDAGGNPVGGEFVVNSVTSGNQQFPTVAGLAASSLLPNGGFIETWFDASTNAVKAKIFDLNGNVAKDEFTVSNNQAGGQQIASVVTQLANGNIVVAWRDASGNDGDPSGSGLDGQILSPTGEKIGDEFLINTALPGTQKQLTITALANGDFVAVWTDPSLVGGDTSADAIKAQVFSATGTKLGGEILVNTLTAGDQINPAVTAFGPNGFIVAWTDNGGNNGGGVQAQTFTVLNTDENTPQQISIAATSTDTDGSETLTTVVSGIPSGAILSDGHGHSSSPGATSVDVSSWNLASLTILPPPDFVGTFQLTATVTSIDSAVLSDGQTHTSTNLAQATQTFSVTVVDEKPTITAFSFANGDTVPENLPNATVIGTVVASDPNVGDQLTYSLSNNANGAFAIDAKTGVVTVADSTRLDFETNPVQTIEVVVTDRGGLTDKTTVTIKLSDVNEAPVASNVNLSTNEDTALSTTAAQLLAAGNVSDPDHGDVDTLTAVGNATHGTVSLVNGVVLFTPAANFSGVAGYDYTVTDAGGLSVTKHVTVDVAPVADTPTLLAGQVVADHANGAGQFPVNPAAAVAFMPSITQLADGGFLVTYNDTSRRGDDPTEGIRGQRFDANGNPVDVHGNAVSPTDPLHGQFLVNSTINRDQLNSKVATLAGGGFVVAWQGQDAGSTSDFDVRAQAYDANGNKAGPEILVNNNQAGSQANISIAALGNGGFVVTFDDTSGDDGSQSGIKARIFDAAGNPVTSELVVNTVTSGNQQFPTVTGLAPSTLLPEGGFIETWFDASTNAVKAQFFDLSGNRVRNGNGDEEFTVSNNQGGGQQIASVVTQLANGNILVAWRDASGRDGDPSGSGLDGQILSPDGKPIGNEFLINTALPGTQKQLTITALANGDFVAVWTDPSLVGGDTSADAIKAQVFSSNGVKLGGEILVNSLTAGDQINPTVTAFGPNGFIIAWTDGGAEGVQAQRFTIANTDENTAQQISIVPTLTDSDGSETLSTVVSGIPAGAILSDGHGHSSAPGATSVDVSSWNLGSVTILPPPDFIGNFQLTVTTSATDSAVLSDGQTHTSTNLAQATQTFNVIVTPPGTSSEAQVIGTTGNDTLQWQVINELGWFDTPSQLNDIKTSDGSTLDHSAVAQLVQAMATYSAGNPGFDPTSATQAPSDPGLQTAIAASWHA